MNKLILLAGLVWSVPGFCQSGCDIVIANDTCEAHIEGQDSIALGEGVKSRIRVDNDAANANCQWKGSVTHDPQIKVDSGLSCCINVNGTNSGQSYSSLNGGGAHFMPGGVVKVNCNNASCIDGSMACDGPGGFVTCSNGSLVHRDCAPGTSCKTTGAGTILCDWPGASD